MRAKLFFVVSVFLTGCETLGIQLEKPEAAPAAAAVTEAPAPAEPLAAIEHAVPGCSVSMSPRWSVAAVGLPSFLVNFSTQLNETRSLPIAIEKRTPTETIFSYKDPAGSANTVTFTTSVTKLKSGVCGMTGTYRMASADIQRPVTMVPLPAPRPAQ